MGTLPWQTIKHLKLLLDQIPVLGTYAKSADPDQTPQIAASDQDLHCVLTGISMQNTEKVKMFTSSP